MAKQVGRINPMSELRPFSELTKDFTPERRQRIEAKKAELRAAMMRSAKQTAKDRR